MRAADAHRKADELRALALSLYSEARVIRSEGLAYKEVERRYDAKYADAYRIDMAHNDMRRIAMRLGHQERLADAARAERRQEVMEAQQ